ncbi:MAG TPA: N-methyl-L-tryptophan oxidase [Candidatus Acidoferrum sp.]|nr:N-methyl-L-tryptophan oxidase [Candidatus Acidoferrum sp.]
MSGQKTYDVAVIGAGVFGAWTAWHLARRGQRVVLVEAYGPAHSRASSGGESRIIRMGYGADELYTRWSQRSLAQWKEFFAASRQALFLQTGVLWMAGKDDARLRDTAATLKRCGVEFEEYDGAALEKRYSQIGLEDIQKGIFEPKSGVLLARRAVAAVVEDAVKLGVEYRCAQVADPREAGAVKHITTSAGERIAAGQFVFACGAWLGKVFPDVLSARIFPSRQEVFFFGIPAGETRFAPPALPTWLFQEDLVYGMPDIENRGLKIAFDEHGEHADPDTQSRIVSQEMTKAVREYVGRRFPALRDAPIVETRVCQYENTSNGDFLIDRHPEMENVWFAGGGSGHGFKHGPAVGEYLAGQLLDGAKAEPRFSLATKETVQKRAVY